MGDTFQIIVLPGAVEDGLPQILFDDGGIWRDIAPSLADTQTRLKQKIEGLLFEVMKQVDKGASIPTNAPALRSPLGEVFKALLPPEVRDFLQKVAGAGGQQRPHLNIYFRSGAEWIPWELLHDGSDFLGLRFAIARLPIVPQATEIRPPRAKQVTKVYSLLAKNVLSNNVLTDWEQTFAGYSAVEGWENRFPNNGNGNFPTLTQLDDARDAQIVHVTCHGSQKEQNEYFWTLDHQNPQFFDYRITTDYAKGAKFAARPLVFGNACSSVVGAIDLAATQGFGSSFMVGGALNFVGTFAPITKKMAVSFAKTFYGNLLGQGGQVGLPIAEALRATKEGYAKAKYPDPSYLFYCLYGPPDSTYQI